MGGKAKPTKHTAKELDAKAKAATQNAGGGKQGLQDRLGGKAGHAKFKCYLCGQQAPSLKNMSEHFEAKHPKENMDAGKCEDLHKEVGSTTVGVAIKGSVKKNKKKGI